MERALEESRVEPREDAEREHLPQGSELSAWLPLMLVALLASPGALTASVLPSPDSATLAPKPAIALVLTHRSGERPETLGMAPVRWRFG
jgi:hypothetical protein